MRWLPLAAILLSGSVCAQPDEVVRSWEKDSMLRGSLLGFSVADCRSGKTIAAYNADRAMVPASTLKILTTTAALSVLGPSFRYQTRIYYTGIFDKTTGVLNGDLIIAGSGDPSLQSEYFTAGKTMITDKWAATLKEKGLKAITGKIIADASYFDRQIPAQWIWADISNYFGTAPSGISFNDNKFTVHFSSGQAGTAATLHPVPKVYLQKDMDIMAAVVSKGSTDEAYVYGDPFGFKRTIQGSIPPGKTGFAVDAALPDPALLCGEALYTSLARIGVKCSQQAESRYTRTDSSKRELLYTHYSPTLDQLVYHTNQKSNNLYCESMLMTLGKGNHTNGIFAVRNYWKRTGLNTDELFMTDGSGLSRANTVSPSFMTNALVFAWKDSTLRKILLSSLPVAGKQGSMSSVGKGTVIEGKLRAKTGYIMRVRAYAGYHTTASGRNIAFSVIFNNYNCSPAQARVKIEKLMVALDGL